MKAVKLNEGFDLVCVWPAIIIGKESISAFEEWFKNEFGIDVQYLEEVKTMPDCDKDGNVMEDTGGRSDLFFAIKHEEISTFAINRFRYAMRWASDVVPQDKKIYPRHVLKYV